MSEKLIKIWVWTIYLTPILWLMGGLLFMYHLIAAAVFVTSIKLKSKIKIDISIFTCLSYFYVCIYLTSILINTNELEYDRVLSGFYNISIWMMGILLIQAFHKNNSSKYIDKIENCLKYLLISWLVVLLISIVIDRLDYEYLMINTFGQIDDPGIVTKLRPIFFLKDWMFDKPTIRICGFAEYPNAAAIVVATIFFYLLVNINKKTAILCILGFVLITYFNSRSTYLAILAMLSIYVYLLKRLNTGIIALIMIIIITILISLLNITDYLDYVLKYREGSSQNRIESYITAINIAWNANPFLGMGHKLRGSDFSFPLGSHSTYVSVFFKTGILGFITFMAIPFIVLLKAYKYRYFNKFGHKEKKIVSVLFGYFVWMIFEDIDFPSLSAFIFFTHLGIISSIYKKIERNNND